MGHDLVEEFRAAVARLEQHHGNPSRAAAACGLSPQLWASWKGGSMPLLPTASVVIEAARKLPRRLKNGAAGRAPPRRR